MLVDSDGNIKLCGFGVIDRSPVESPRLSSVHYRYLAVSIFTANTSLMNRHTQRRLLF